MSGTCISHIMRASVRPCMGHVIGIEDLASTPYSKFEAMEISDNVPNGSMEKV
ncbi:hypothetical protein F383_11019 [Gossypium arboreum]|uniref:Uncharacterized protein n=1 Tax=Gossypium arboreum TaxID=29729 RepID=A0A0B0NBC3_GOSAR|nr:hypothetical protein F383_11019 [Gossypium arboreum]